MATPRKPLALSSCQKYAMDNCQQKVQNLYVCVCVCVAFQPSLNFATDLYLVLLGVTYGPCEECV